MRVLEMIITTGKGGTITYRARNKSVGGYPFMPCEAEAYFVSDELIPKIEQLIADEYRKKAQPRVRR